MNRFNINVSVQNERVVARGSSWGQGGTCWGHGAVVWITGALVKVTGALVGVMER